MRRVALLLSVWTLAASCYLFGGEPTFSGAAGDATTSDIDVGAADAAVVTVDAAGRPDAMTMTPDAATPADAMVDCDAAASADAMVSDAGSTDAMTPDAAAPADAMVPDAGPSDASSSGGGDASVILSVTVGAAHTCAIVNGAAMCWGSNSQGQLGRTTSDPRPDFVQGLHGLDGGVTSIAAGDDHTCAVVGGAVTCWGANTNGQLGVDTVTDYTSSPVTMTLQHVKTVVAGAHHTCALLEDKGTVFCWGRNDHMQLGVPLFGGPDAGLFHPTPAEVSYPSGDWLKDVQAIAAGGDHTCVLMADSTVQCWGENANGELGIGDSTGKDELPASVNWVPDGGPTPAVQAIAAGRNHTCAVARGTVYCWGANDTGQLGDGTWTSRSQPDLTKMAFTEGWGVQAIAAGGAMTPDGGTPRSGTTCAIAGVQLFCWGDGTDGQLGDSQTLSNPARVEVDYLDSAERVAAGQHSCAVVGASVYCWGLDSSGEVGSACDGGICLVRQKVPGL